MADLPVVNAIDELKESNKDQRERLQKSLRGGLLNVVKSVDRLHDAFQMGLNLQREQMDLNARLAMAQLEAERERQRKEDTSKTKVEGSGSEKGKMNLLGILGIVAGIGAALTAFAAGFVAALSNTLRGYAKAFTPEFLKSFDNFKNSIIKGFQSLRASVVARFEFLKKNVMDDVRKIGSGIRSLLNQFGLFLGGFKNTKLFFVLDTLFLKPLNGIVRNIRVIGEILRPVAAGADEAKKSVGMIGRFVNVFRTTFSALNPIIRIAGNLGKILGRIFLPITAVMAVWEGVSGLYEGFVDTEGDMIDKILGGLEGGITNLVDFFISAPLDLVKDIISWAAGKLGFENASEVLDSFSFSDLFRQVIGGLFDGVRGVKDFVVSLFTIPEDATLLEKIGLTAAGIVDVITYPINLAVNFIKGMFGLTNEELGGDEPFRLSLFVQDTVQMVIDKITGLFSGILDFDFMSLVPRWARRFFGSEETTPTAESTSVAPEQVSSMEKDLEEINRSIRLAQNKQRLFSQGAENESNVMKSASYSETADAAQMRVEELLIKKQQLEGALIDAQSKAVADANRAGTGGGVAIQGGDVFNQPQTNMYQPITVQGASATRSKSSPQTRDVFDSFAFSP
jgi:hypothetical protein